MEDSRHFLKLYLKSKLRAGRMYHDHIQVSDDSQVFMTILPIIEEFEKRYLSSEPNVPDFAELAESPDCIFQLLDDIIDGEIHWGRICAIFALAGLMIDACIRTKQIEQFEKIIDFVSWYMYSRQIENWIVSQGGWSAFHLGNGNKETKKWTSTLLSFTRNVMSLWQYINMDI